MMCYRDWVEKQTIKIALPIFTINGIVKLAVEIDRSLEALNYLKDMGFTHVRWINSEYPYDDKWPCPTCEALHDNVWTIDEFLSDIKFDAPIYGKSHPGCRCFLEVYKDDPGTKLEPVIIEATK